MASYTHKCIMHVLTSVSSFGEAGSCQNQCTWTPVLPDQWSTVSTPVPEYSSSH